MADNLKSPMTIKESEFLTKSSKKGNSNGFTEKFQLTITDELRLLWRIKSVILTTQEMGRIRV
jgi:hypothetical protein